MPPKKYTSKDDATITRLLAEGASRKEMAKAIGRSLESLKARLRCLRAQSYTGSKVDGEISSERGPRIKTLNDLLQSAEVDLETYEVASWDANKWEVGTFVDGVAITEPLYQVKAKLRRKAVSVSAIRATVEKALAGKKLPAIKPPAKTGGKLLEISIPDLHLGKLAWSDETGHGDWDSNIAVQAFRDAVTNFISRVNQKEIGQILLPVGNDFFNVDNAKGETSAGTPQDEDGRYQRSFRMGCELLTETINRLSKIAHTRVIIVPGNHDTERAFYLGEFLAAFYRNSPGVAIDNKPTIRKYHHFGATLIGFTHGDRIKTADLSSLAQVEQRQAWGASRYCEWHLGHLHRESSIETAGCILRVIPSLCEPEAWHAKSGYVTSQKGAQAFLYDKRGGLESIFIYRRA